MQISVLLVLETEINVHSDEHQCMQISVLLVLETEINVHSDEHFIKFHLS